MYIILTMVVILSNIYLYFKIKNLISLILNKKINNFIKNCIIILIISLIIIMFLSFSINVSIIKIISNYYLGFMLYFTLIFIMMDIIKLFMKLFKFVISRKFDLYLNIVFIVILSLVLIVGIYNDNTINVVNYDINISKDRSLGNNLKIALVSDLHIGYNFSCDYYQKMVNIINSKNPDLILIVGDIFDNPKDELKNINDYINIMKKLNSKYGTFATLGNHDVISNINMVKEYIKSMNITLLQDENVIVNEDVNLIGINTNHITKLNSYSDILSNVDLNKPSIVMVHEPINIEELMNNNIDLIVSGHTHNGQTFPLNLVVNEIYYNAYGIKNKNNTTSIVTSGVGLWGPKIRIGTKSEIVFINMNFAK